MSRLGFVFVEQEEETAVQPLSDLLGQTDLQQVDEALEQLMDENESLAQLDDDFERSVHDNDNDNDNEMSSGGNRKMTERDRIAHLLSTKYSNDTLFSYVYTSTPLHWMFVRSDVMFYCDVCQKRLGSWETRFNCIDCGNFDLCSQCFLDGRCVPRHNERKHWNSVTNTAENYFVKMAGGRLPWVISSEPTEATTETVTTTPSAVTDSISCSANTVINALKLYSDRPAFGRRLYKIMDRKTHQREYMPAYQWYTYGQILERVEHVSTGIMQYLKSRDLVGICAPGSPDWVVVDFSCLRQSIVTVPIPQTMTPADVRLLIGQSSIRALFFASEYLDIIIDSLLLVNTGDIPSVSVDESVGSFTHLQYLIQMDDAGDGDDHEEINGDEQTHVSSSRIRMLQARLPHLTILRLSEIEQQGSTLDLVNVVPTNPEDMVSIVYTSGSTGTPKGAVFSDRIWSNELSQTHSYVYPRVTICIFPMAHMSGRLAVIKSIVTGGRLGFPTGDMSTLFEDIKLISPSILSLVPRVADMIYQHYQAECIRERSLHPEKKDTIIRRRVRSRMSTMFGHRLVTMTIGSAPSNPKVLLLIKTIFKVPIIEGYGSTEGGPIAHEGAQHKDVQYKLVDVPELSYYATDQPYPRGELCVKSDLTIGGYYKNEEATRANFDDEGYFKTGDIVELRPNNNVVIIDRRNYIFKLSNGEFVSPSKLELMYTASPYIQQMFIHGNSLYSYLVAVIVPHGPVVDAWMNEHHVVQEEPVRSRELKELLRREMQDIASRNQVRPYEIPRDFIIDFTPFKDNNLLTISNKLARAKLKQFYGEQLNQLYDHITEQQDKRLHSEQYSERGGTVSDRVKSAIEIVLGIDIHNPEQSYFIQSGGDSISAVRLASLIQQSCNISIPLSVVMDPTMTVHMLQVYAETMESQCVAQQQQKLHPSDIHLTIDTKQLLQQSSNLLNTSRTRVNGILLTGANGYLGRFIALSLLNLLPNCKLYAMVRATDEQAAREKFEQSLRRLCHHYHHNDILSSHSVTVVRGDISQKQFGLSDSQYFELSNSVDTIVHNAAMVNHAFGYDDLQLVNVRGTDTVIQFAATNARKSIHYISSISSLEGTHLEDVDLRRGNYGRLKERGYSTSKWASEILVEQARDYGLPVTIIRPTLMIGASCNGDSNISDWFTRLLAGVIETKLRPVSFSCRSANDSSADGASDFFDAVPVDYAATVIAHIVKKEREGTLQHYHFNIVSSNTAPVTTLDHIFDWVESCGYGLESVDDYSEWYERICDRVLGASHSKQQPLPPWSLLPVLRSFENPRTRSHTMIRYAGDNTSAVLSSLDTGDRGDCGGGGGVTVPCSTIDRYLVSKILNFLVDRQVIEKPKDKETS